MKTILFDIETGPLPEKELAAVMPPFDPSEVKTGNIKDPEKIAAKIAEAEVNHKRNFIENAALDPLTGRVVAIGLLHHSTREFVVIGHDDEARTLAEFWSVCRAEIVNGTRLVGFNILQFDLPFLLRRSWKHRVPVPLGLRRGRYWSDELSDLRELWQLGDRQARGSLDCIAKHLGVGEKNGDGKEFARLWVEDRTKALGYLRNDLELTGKIAEALGCVSAREPEETCASY
jgi:uncharacterized protein YprB with RNaseH-like and TPR domain